MPRRNTRNNQRAVSRMTDETWIKFIKAMTPLLIATIAGTVGILTDSGTVEHNTPSAPAQNITIQATISQSLTTINND